MALTAAKLVEIINELSPGEKAKVKKALGIEGGDAAAYEASSDAQLKYLQLEAKIAAAQGQKIKQLELAKQAFAEYDKQLAGGFVQAEERNKLQEEFAKSVGLSGKSIEKLKEEMAELTPSFKRGKEAANDFGGSIARKLGMASDHSKTFIGKMQELNEVLRDDESRKAFQKRISEIFTFTNMAGALLKGITEITLAFAFGVDNAVAKFVAATGASREYTSQIREVGGAMLQFGVTAEGAGKAITALYSKFPGFINLSKASQVELGKNVAALEKLGVSADMSAELMGSLTKSFKVSSTEAADMVKDLAFGAKAIGKPISSMIAGFKEANKYLASYGKESVNVFKKIASSAQAAGVEVSDVLALSKKFDTFSSAAETAAKFSAVFGTNLSALDLVTMDVQDRIPYLVQQFQATGKEFSQMNRYAQLSAAQMLGFGDNIEKAGKILSMSTTEFGKYNAEQEKAAKQQQEYDQILKDAMPALMKLKMAMMKLATNLSPLTEKFNDLATGILDLAIYLRENFYKAIFIVVGVLALVGFFVVAFGTKVALAAIPVKGLAGSIGSLALALKGLNLSAIPAGVNITIIGNAAAGAGTRMAGLIAAVGLAAIGIGVMSFGVAELVRAFGEFPDAIWPVITTIGVLTAALIVLGIAGYAFGPGMIIAGKAMFLFGTGVGIAASGIALLLQGLSSALEGLAVFEKLSMSTVLVVGSLAYAIGLLAIAMTALGNPLSLLGMYALNSMLVGMTAMADRIAKITEGMAVIATANMSQAFAELSDALSDLDSALSGKIELKSTIENLALISTGQSSRTLGGAADTTTAIKDAFTNLGEMFKPTVKVELELDNEKLAEFIKTVSVK